MQKRLEAYGKWMASHLTRMVQGNSGQVMSVRDINLQQVLDLVAQTIIANSGNGRAAAAATGCSGALRPEVGPAGAVAARRLPVCHHHLEAALSGLAASAFTTSRTGQRLRRCRSWTSGGNSAARAAALGNPLSRRAMPTPCSSAPAGSKSGTMSGSVRPSWRPASSIPITTIRRKRSISRSHPANGGTLQALDGARPRRDHLQSPRHPPRHARP